MNQPVLIVLALWIGVALICLVAGTVMTSRTYRRPQPRRRLKHLEDKHALMLILL
jgi:hypothetical protein